MLGSRRRPDGGHVRQTLNGKADLSRDPWKPRDQFKTHSTFLEHRITFRLPRRLDHQSPPWTSFEAQYLITVCARFRVRTTFCSPEVGAAVLDSIRLRHERKVWHCELAVLMPDHIHLILNLSDEASLVTVMRDWKSWLAKSHGSSGKRTFLIIVYGTKMKRAPRQSTCGIIRYELGSSSGLGTGLTSGWRKVFYRRRIGGDLVRRN